MCAVIVGTKQRITMFKDIEIFENVPASVLVEVIPLFAGFIEMGRSHYRDWQDSEELAKEVVDWWIQEARKKNFTVINNIKENNK